MKISDIIRSILIKIDSIEPAGSDDAGELSPLSTVSQDDEELARMKQIAGLQSDGCGEYANTPDEKYASIDAVTVDAGGGVNKPKHPSDIRGEHPSMYPASQAGFGE